MFLARLGAKKYSILKERRKESADTGDASSNEERSAKEGCANKLRSALQSYLSILHDNFLLVFMLCVILQLSNFNFLTGFNGFSFFLTVAFAGYYGFFFLVQAALLNNSALIMKFQLTRSFSRFIDISSLTADLRISHQLISQSKPEFSGSGQTLLGRCKVLALKNYHILTLFKKLLLVVVGLGTQMRPELKLIAMAVICCTFIAVLVWLRPYRTLLHNAVRLLNDVNFLTIIIVVVINEYYYLKLAASSEMQASMQHVNRFKKLSYIVFYLTITYVLTNIAY